MDDSAASVQSEYRNSYQENSIGWLNEA